MSSSNREEHRVEEERHDFGDDDDYEYDDDRHDKTASLKSGGSSLSVSGIRVPYDMGDVVATGMRLTRTTNAESERIGGGRKHMHGRSSPMSSSSSSLFSSSLFLVHLGDDDLHHHGGAEDTIRRS